MVTPHRQSPPSLTDKRKAVLIREVRSPVEQRGDLIGIWTESRCVRNPTVLYYSLRRETWDSEDHDRLIRRTRRVSVRKMVETGAWLELHLGEPIRIVRSSPRAADDVPALW